MSRKVVAPPDKPKKYSKPVEASTTSLDDMEALNVHKKQREDKRDEKLAKEMMYGKDAYKRTVNATKEERDRKHAQLHTFGGGPEVHIVWDLNPDAIRDQIFALHIGGERVLLSAVEIQKYIRWV